MSEPVQYIRRENRLGRLLSKPGGVKITAAITEAEHNLAAIRGETLAEVDRNMELLRRSALAVDKHSARDEVYAHANVIAGLAGSCGLPDLGRAAYLLCELTDRYLLADTWNRDGVAVCLNALMLLRAQPALADEAYEEVLNGLAELVAKATGDGPEQDAAAPQVVIPN